MRALVIGGGGYIGQRLTSRLLSEHWDVTSLELRGRDDRRGGPDAPVRLIEGDRNDEAVLRRALACEADVVFDLVAYAPAESQAIVTLGAGRLGRLVHLSTVSVYSAFPATGRATERTAVRFEGTEDGYGPSKAACERVLEQAAADTGFSYVILRAGQLMGPLDPCSRQGYLVLRILASQPILHPGHADGFLWLLFVDDLIDGLMRAATAPVLGRVFHLAQEEAPSLRDHVEELARGLGRAAPEIRSLDVERLTELGFRIHGFAFARTVSVPPDTTAARQALGWRCTPHHRAVAVTLADLLDNDRATAYATWPGRDTTQARLSGAHEWIHAAREARALAGMVTEPDADADTVLGWLSDDPFGPARPELVESELWSSRLGKGSLPSDSAFATVPAELIHRLARSGGTWSPSTARTEGDSPGRTFPNLVAAVELDKWNEGRAWIFSSSPPPALPQYGWTSEPLQVDCVPLATGLGMDVRPGTRLLLELTCDEDAGALAGFLRGCLERRRLQIDDLATWGRRYIVGAASWVPREVRAQNLSTGRDVPWQPHVVPTVWVLAHSVARLLCRAGLEGTATIRMGFEPGGVGQGTRLPATAAVCWVGARTVVVDLQASRAVEVASAIADVLCDQTRVER